MRALYERLRRLILKPGLFFQFHPLRLHFSDHFLRQRPDRDAPVFLRIMHLPDIFFIHRKKNGQGLLTSGRHIQSDAVAGISPPGVLPAVTGIIRIITDFFLLRDLPVRTVRHAVKRQV